MRRHNGGNSLKILMNQRFTERGNGEEFTDVFIGRWDEWMDALRSRKPALAIELGPGEHLLGAMGRLGFGAGAGSGR